MLVSIETAIEKIQAAKSITFLTGAGVSTPSGIPDYRSLSGVYQGIEAPEYLLSHTCMVNEPDKFYQFVKYLYHPDAQPNIIHQTMAELGNERDVWVISQNIDGLHEKAGSKQRIDFHGTLYHCHCRKCGADVPWQTYLTDWHHEGCGGQVRPDIVLYEEGFSEDIINTAIDAVSAAELVVVVGTSLQVYPFAGLLHYQDKKKCLIINQTTLEDHEISQVLARGEAVFQRLSKNDGGVL
jgi:NAD-dependent deacetylase